MELFNVPYIKVQPGSTIQYYLLEDGAGNVVRKNIDPLKEEENLRNNGTQGYLSKKAKKRLADCVDWINELTTWKNMNVDGMTLRYKLTFMTLTLPSPQYNSVVADKAGKMMLRDINNLVVNGKGIMNYIDDLIKKECLNQFLTELRQLYGMKLYIWRAEAQKNGNVHFHIVTDIGIHYKTVRDVWNRIINKLGYVDEYRKEHETMNLEEYRKRYNKRLKFKKKVETEEEYLKRREKVYYRNVEENWSNPNSTDIHAVKRIRDLRKYVTKYLCKEVEPIEDRLIFGRLWFISQALSEARNMADMVCTDIEEEIAMLTDKDKEKAVYTEHCFILRMTVKEIQKYGGIFIPEIFYDKLKFLKDKIYVST